MGVLQLSLRCACLAGVTELTLESCIFFLLWGVNRKLVL